MSARIYGYRDDQSSGTKLLRVIVHCGKSLVKKDHINASSAYVRIDLNSIHNDELIDSVTTNTKENQLNPCWNEEFLFRVEPIESKLDFRVYDATHVGRDEFLGSLELTLNNTATEQENHAREPIIYTLRPKISRTALRRCLEIYHAFVGPEKDADGNKHTPVAGDRNTSTGCTENEIHHSYENVAIMSGLSQDTTGDAVGNAVDSVAADKSTCTGCTENVSCHIYEDVARMSRLIENTTEEVCALTDFKNELPGQVNPTGSRISAHKDKHMLPSQDCTSITHADRTALPTARRIFNKATRSQLETISETSAKKSSVAYKISRKISQTRQVENKPPVPAPRRVSNSPIYANLLKDTSDIRSESCTTYSYPDISDGLETLGPASVGSNCNGKQAGPDETISESIADGSFTRLADSELYVLFRESILNSTPASSKEAPVNSAQAALKPKASPSQAATNSALPDTEAPTVSVLRAPNGQNFFIDHRKHRTTWTDPRRDPTQSIPVEKNLGALPEGWEERQHFDGRLFFINHKTLAVQWQDPRLALSPQIINDPEPYTYYKHKYGLFKLTMPNPPIVPKNFEVHVSRNTILEDSFKIINSVSADVLRSKLSVVFEDEPAVSLTREWFSLLSKKIFDPAYGLFAYTSEDAQTLQINSNSGLCIEDHLTYFNFAGRIAGMAVYHGNLLEAHFGPHFYKVMLQQPLVLADLESVDTFDFKALMWIKEHDPSPLRKTFSLDEESLGMITNHELKPGGALILLTESNKREYIRQVVEWRLVKRVKQQMDAFLYGFASIIPLKRLDFFDAHELELLMCGRQVIDVDDWCKHTVYKGAYHSSHVVIQWFWRAVLSFSNELRARLLQFATTTSRVPMNGFGELQGSNGPQMFTIESRGELNKQPEAHTCFNKLDLPLYENYAQLKEKLMEAMGGVV